MAKREVGGEPYNLGNQRRPDGGSVKGREISGTRMEQFTAMRFVASLLVVISHTATMTEGDNWARWFAFHVIDNGHSSVSFFFMLSGFVLSRAYSARMNKGAIPYRTFIVKRIARIWPLHVLIALPLLSWAFLRDGVSAVPIIAANLMLLQSWVPSGPYYFSLNFPSWSLSTELFLYVTFPFLTVLTSRRLLGVCGAALTLSVAAPIAFDITGQSSLEEANGDVFAYWFTYINPVIRLSEFSIGMMLYRTLSGDYGRIFPRFSGQARSDHEVSAFLKMPRWADSAAAGSFLGCMIAFPLIGIKEIYLNQMSYLLPLTALVATLAVGTGHLSSWLSRQKWLRLLGEASFSLYLIHAPILRRLFQGYVHLGEPIPLVLFGVLACAFCVLLSCGVHLLIEKPLCRIADALADRYLLNSRRQPA